ncbi:sugar-binding transcriptional regulator [Scrofimicrobium sp. R131]|uniref:Sugar-binding domain-containing protein n=1 Tax=Scrofimicrobium appendicitidis TaxID=3079930 RepID=A0AAU7V9D4_9ACTO
MSIQPADSVELLAEVAERFYVEDQSKTEIGKDLNLSRFKVARLLEEARDSGIVQITIRRTRSTYYDLEIALANHLQLERVIVVDADPIAETERDHLGEAAAEYVGRIVQKDDIIGLAWGRTLLPVANHLDPLPRVTLVQLTGVVGNDITRSPIEVAARIRENSHSETKALLAPLYAASVNTARALRREPSVQNVFAYYDRLDIALSSIGSWQPRVTQLESEFAPEISQELDEKGVAADFCGLFFDAEGHQVLTDLDHRRISIEPDQIARTTQVIAVAGGLDKTNALHSMALTGLLTCLVTTSNVAEQLLAMTSVSRPTWTRPHHRLRAASPR